jgi:beta-glucosidase
LIVKWPDGFWWGTGASSTQCEGAAPASDWWDWERSGRAPESGEGNGFGRLYAEDFARFAALGLTHHRLSLEWARLEPEEGVHDAGAVAHYRAVLDAARDAGITPWVCLHHFTLPRWFATEGAFTMPVNRTEYWRRHVDFVAETFGDLVGGWQPVNEANIYPRLAYRGSGFAPGLDDRELWFAAIEGIQLATAEAAVCLKQTGVPVSSVFSLSCEVVLDEEPETQRLAASFRARNWDDWLTLYRDGALALPGRTPVERPDLAGSFDLIGFSFYANIGVRAGRVVPYPSDAPTSPLGYTIAAEGLDLVLRRLHEELPGTPLLVAEYGIGTDDDAQRADYLREGLRVVNEALARDVDVRGFFHWTGVDNYEWLLGYDLCFGLFDRDRTRRDSATVLAAEALGRPPA